MEFLLLHHAVDPSRGLQACCSGRNRRLQHLALRVVDGDALLSEGDDGEQWRAFHVTRLASGRTLGLATIWTIPPVIVIGIALVGIGPLIPWPV